MAGDPTLSPWLDSASPSVENSRLAGLPLEIRFQELRGTFCNKALKSHSVVGPRKQSDLCPKPLTYLSSDVTCLACATKPGTVSETVSPECLLEGPVYIKSEAPHCVVVGTPSPPLKARSYQNEPGLQCFSKTQNINIILGPMRNTCHQTPNRRT